MIYRIDLEQMPTVWANFLLAQPENTTLEDWMIDQGVSLEFLRKPWPVAVRYYLEFVSDKAKTMFILKYS